MAIGKSLRFDIFARDGFVCQYCGKRPPDVVLELDHIHPQSKGGTDDPINLITACYDCNRGKSAKVITEVAPRPDADLAFLKVQQEIAEVERFLASKKRLDELNSVPVTNLQDVWQQYLTQDVPTDIVFLPWIKTYGAEEIIEAVKIASFQHNQMGKFDRYGSDPFFKLVRYIGGILRNRRARGESNPPQEEVA